MMIWMASDSSRFRLVNRVVGAGWTWRRIVDISESAVGTPSTMAISRAVAGRRGRPLQASATVDVLVRHRCPSRAATERELAAPTIPSQPSKLEATIATLPRKSSPACWSKLSRA